MNTHFKSHSLLSLPFPPPCPPIFSSALCPASVTQSWCLAPSSLELILQPCFKSFLTPAPACWLHPYTGMLISTSTIPLAPIFHGSPERAGCDLSFHDNTSTVVEAPPGSPSPLSVTSQSLSCFALKFSCQEDTTKPSSSPVASILLSTSPYAPDLGSVIGFHLKLHFHFQKTGPQSSL